MAESFGCAPACKKESTDAGFQSLTCVYARDREATLPEVRRDHERSSSSLESVTQPSGRRPALVIIIRTSIDRLPARTFLGVVVARPRPAYKGD